MVQFLQQNLQNQLKLHQEIQILMIPARIARIRNTNEDRREGERTKETEMILQHTVETIKW